MSKKNTGMFFFFFNDSNKKSFKWFKPIKSKYSAIIIHRPIIAAFIARITPETESKCKITKKRTKSETVLGY